MTTQVPLFSEPLPDSFEMSPPEFEDSAAVWMSELNPHAVAMNAQAVEVNALAARAEAAAGELANTVWVSGTSYTAGQVRYSPVDFFMYRRKTNGAGTTDPSLDSTNWALQTKTETGGSDTSSSAVDIALTSTDGRLQVISMTASNKKVTLPAATSISKGSPIYVIRNAGNYRFAVRKNGGVFLCYVNPGQVLAFDCSDNTTSAGVWAVSGGVLNNIYDGNDPEVLNAVDSREICVAMLSTTKAICCYKNNSTTFLNAVILNFGSASGTPVVVSAEAVRAVSVISLSATQAVVAYQLTGSNTSVKGYVLDISSNTITPGSVQTITTQATTGNFGTSLVALTTTKLLVAYYRGGASNIKQKVLDVSGTTITPSTEADIDTTNSNGTAPSIRTGYITATKVLAAFLSDVGRVILRHQTITGSTPATSGSALTIIPPSTALFYDFCLVVLSATRAVVVRAMHREQYGLIAYLIDTSGATPALVATRRIPANYSAAGAHVAGTKLDANHAYISWPGGFDGIEGVELTITDDDRILIGEPLDRLEAGVSAEIGYLACQALDSSHVMQVSRNASTFLSAKTIEVNP